MSDRPQTPQKRNIAMKVLEETQHVGRSVEELKPLLDLLDPREGGESDPIEEIKELLGQIVKGQRHLLNAIEDNTNHVIALRQSRRLKPSGNDPATQ